MSSNQIIKLRGVYLHYIPIMDQLQNIKIENLLTRILSTCKWSSYHHGTFGVYLLTNDKEMRDFNISTGPQTIATLVSWGMALRNTVFWMLSLRMSLKTSSCGHRDSKLVYRNSGENWLRHKLGYQNALLILRKVSFAFSTSWWFCKRDASNFEQESSLGT